jgi:hypothetical protein
LSLLSLDVTGASAAQHLDRVAMLGP